MARVMIITADPLPMPAQPASGAGMRAWGLAAGLAARAHDVILATANTAGALTSDEARRGPIEVESFPKGPVFKVAEYARGDLTDFVRARHPEVVVLQHWGGARDLASVACPLVIDLAGPHWLERWFWGADDLDADLSEKIEALGRADFVLCSGQWQRRYFLPFLFMAGWRPDTRNLCPVIPFSWFPMAADTWPRDPEALVYGGMFLPWQDPRVGLRSALKVMDRTGRGRLHLYGGPHPSGDVSGGCFDELWGDLRAHPRSHIHELTGFDSLIKAYGHYGAALDLMAPNCERELAFTTRTIVYMACGLPVIHNNYSELSGWIERYEAGWSLTPEDASAVEDMVQRVLDDPEETRRRGLNALRLVEERFHALQTIEPLAQFIESPCFRDDKVQRPLQWVSRQRRIEELENELAETRTQLDSLQGKWWARWARKGRVWGPLVALIAAPVVLAGVGAVWLSVRLSALRDR